LNWLLQQDSGSFCQCPGCKKNKHPWVSSLLVSAQRHKINEAKSSDCGSISEDLSKNERILGGAKQHEEG
jgi:hypothetical protein